MSRTYSGLATDAPALSQLLISHPHASMLYRPWGLDTNGSTRGNDGTHAACGSPTAPTVTHAKIRRAVMLGHGELTWLHAP